MSSRQPLPPLAAVVPPASPPTLSPAPGEIQVDDVEAAERPPVYAGITLPWRQGQVEGQVHRLKLVTRAMYGRAGFPLLRRRVLAAA